MESKGPWTADRRIYLDKEGNVVAEDSPERVELLVSEGKTIPYELAEKHGLVGEKAETGAKTKAVEKAPANKSAAKSDDK